MRFWQRIVWSDISTGKTCAQFADGAFGPNTDAKTRTWQSTFSVGVDGSVGPQTWSRAQSNLRLTSSNVQDDRSNGTGIVWTWYYYYYTGKLNSFYMAFAKQEWWMNGYRQSIEYEPWEFHNCSNSLVPITW